MEVHFAGGLGSVTLTFQQLLFKGTSFHTIRLIQPTPVDDEK